MRYNIIWSMWKASVTHVIMTGWSHKTTRIHTYMCPDFWEEYQMTDHDTLGATSSGSNLVNRNDWEEARPLCRRKKNKTERNKVHWDIFRLTVTNTPVILSSPPPSSILLCFPFYFCYAMNLGRLLACLSDTPSLFTPSHAPLSDLHFFTPSALRAANMVITKWDEYVNTAV